MVQIFIVALVVLPLVLALPPIFKICGWPRGATLAFPERMGAILFLICSVVMVAIDFWYPMYVMAHNSSPDDRYGFFIFGAFPFYVIGAVIAGIAYYRLLKVVVKGRRSFSNIVFLSCGTLLALVGCSPLLLFVWRIVVPIVGLAE